MPSNLDHLYNLAVELNFDNLNNIKLDPLTHFYILKLYLSDLDLPGFTSCT